MKHSLGTLHIDPRTTAIAMAHHSRSQAAWHTFLRELARVRSGAPELLLALGEDDPDRDWVGAVTAVVAELNSQGRRLTLADCEREPGLDGFCNVVLFDRTTVCSVRKGDEVYAGVQVLRTPATGLVAAPRQLRQVCSNGSVAYCGERSGFEVEAHEVATAVVEFLARDEFARVGERLRWAAHVAVDDLDAVLAAAAVATSEPELRRAFRAGDDPTLFGLLNAATALAHGEPDPARRLDRERDAERLLAAAELLLPNASLPRAHGAFA